VHESSSTGDVSVTNPAATGHARFPPDGGSKGQGEGRAWFSGTFVGIVIPIVILSSVWDSLRRLGARRILSGYRLAGKLRDDGFVGSGFE
jgi:hypothetical protein